MTTDKKTKKQKTLLWRILHGQVLTPTFFEKHWLLIFFVTIMILICITNKYQCQTSIEEIKALEQKLEIVKTKCIDERSKYMGSIRESAMQQIIDTLHLNLQVQECPPFKITYANEKRE